MGRESLDIGRNNVTLVEGCLTAVNVELMFLTLVNWNVVAGVFSDIVLSGSDDLVFGIVKELVPMCQPANCSRNHEKDREHISWEAQGFVNDSTVEIHIRV